MFIGFIVIQNSKIQKLASKEQIIGRLHKDKNEVLMLKYNLHIHMYVCHLCLCGWVVSICCSCYSVEADLYSTQCTLWTTFWIVQVLK